MKAQSSRHAVGAPMSFEDPYTHEQLLIVKSVDISDQCAKPREGEAVVMNFAQAPTGLYIEAVFSRNGFEWASHGMHLASLKRDLARDHYQGSVFNYMDSRGLSPQEFCALAERVAPQPDLEKIVQNVRALLSKRGHDFCRDLADQGHFPRSVLNDVMEEREREWRARGLV